MHYCNICTLDSYTLWQVCPFSAATVYIANVKWGSSIVAGNHPDGHIYLQTPDDRSNAKWKLEPDPLYNDFYRIKELARDAYIYSGFKFDGKVYEGPINQGHLQNFRWKLQKIRANQFGQAVYLIDGGHGKALAAGEHDGNLHLVDVINEPYAQWGFVLLDTQ